MKLKEFIVEGLHGHINQEVKFFPDITLLVGINGAGKTSVLNLISAILKPDMIKLSATFYEWALLRFEHSGAQWEVLSTRGVDRFTYELNKVGDSTPHTLELHVPYLGENDPISVEFWKDNLQREILAQQQENESVWKMMSRMVDPIVVGLDRQIYIDEAEDRYISHQKGAIRRRSEKVKSQTPIQRIESLVSGEYRRHKAKELDMVRGLKDELMLFAFRPPLTTDSILTAQKAKLNLQGIRKARTRVMSYLKEFEPQILNLDSDGTISKYFFALESIVSEISGAESADKTLSDFITRLNANQFRALQDVVNEFERVETELRKSSERLNTFIEAVNGLFAEGGKKLIFNPETTELRFVVVPNKGFLDYDVHASRPLGCLSSGEKQILILLAYVAFAGIWHDSASKGNVILIDEPELSLHVFWQEQLLDVLSKLLSDNTQVVLATHSPILADARRKKAVSILPPHRAKKRKG